MPNPFEFLSRLRFISYLRDQEYIEVDRFLRSCDPVNENGIEAAIGYSEKSIESGRRAVESLDDKGSAMLRLSGGTAVVATLFEQRSCLSGMNESLFSLAIVLTACGAVCCLGVLWPRDMPVMPNADQAVRHINKHGVTHFHQRLPFAFRRAACGFSIVARHKAAWLQLAHICLISAALFAAAAAACNR